MTQHLTNCSFKNSTRLLTFNVLILSHDHHKSLKESNKELHLKNSTWNKFYIRLSDLDGWFAPGQWRHGRWQHSHHTWESRKGLSPWFPGIPIQTRQHYGRCSVIGSFTSAWSSQGCWRLHRSCFKGYPDGESDRAFSTTQPAHLTPSGMDISIFYGWNKMKIKAESWLVSYKDPKLNLLCSAVSGHNVCVNESILKSQLWCVMSVTATLMSLFHFTFLFSYSI